MRSKLPVEAVLVHTEEIRCLTKTNQARLRPAERRRFAPDRSCDTRSEASGNHPSRRRRFKTFALAHGRLVVRIYVSPEASFHRCHIVPEAPPACLLKFRARSRENLRRPMPISKLAVAISEVPAAWHKFHVKFGRNLNRCQRGLAFCRAPWKQLTVASAGAPDCEAAKGSKAVRGFESLSLRQILLTCGKSPQIKAFSQPSPKSRTSETVHVTGTRRAAL